MIEVNATALAAHPFLHGMSREQLSVLAEAARDVPATDGTRLAWSVPVLPGPPSAG